MLKRFQTNFAVALCIWGLALPHALAQNPPGESTEIAPFGFSRMEIFKIDEKTRNLCVGDFNGDGLTDLVFANNDTARIEFLLQVPESERKEEAPPAEKGVNVLPSDTRFKREFYLTSKLITSLAAADFDRDGLTDIAFYASPSKLNIMLRTLDAWQKPIVVFDIENGSASSYALTVGDLNNDVKPDIVLLGNSETFILYQEENGKFADPVHFPNGEDGIDGITICDLNGDGLRDLLYFKFSSATPIRARLQGSAGLKPEMAFELPEMSAFEVKDITGDGRDEVLTIERVAGRLKVLVFSTEETIEERPFAAPLFVPLPKTTKTKSRSLALGNVDQDAIPDVVVTDESSNEIVLVRQDDEGALSRIDTFPTYSGARDLGIADVDGDGAPEVVVLSRTEKAIGVSRWQDERLTFPGSIGVKGEPICLELLDADADGNTDVAYVTKEVKQRMLCVAAHTGRGFAPLQELVLESLRDDPSDIVRCDANRDGRWDVLIFVPRDPAVLCLNTGKPEGNIFQVTELKGEFAKGFLGDMKPNAFTSADVDGDGVVELVFGKKNLARSLFVGAGSELVILDQYNAKRSDSDIGAIAFLDVDADGISEILMSDKTQGEITILRRGESGKYEPWRSVKLPGFIYETLSICDANSDGIEDLLLGGGDRLGVLLRGTTGHSLDEAGHYETDVLKGRLNDVTVGDLNADGRPDVIVTEDTEKVLEILCHTPGEDEEMLAKSFHFRVFEKKAMDTFEGGGGVARQILIADVTQDGKNDLVLVIHDRIILYPQD